MSLAAAQAIDQPGVNGAEGEVARVRLLPRVFHVLQEPGDLRPRKIGVGHQAGLLANDAVEFFPFQLVAHQSRAPALPDDSVVNRLSARAIPDDGRLALVGDADGGDVFGSDAGLRERFARAVELRTPDVFGVVFDPAGPWEDLREFLLRDARDASLSVE